MRRVLLAIVFLLGGCDLLFPEFGGSQPPASGDGGGDGATGGPRVSGRVCVLADVRDPTTCMEGGAGFRVSVEETRDETTCDAHGNFVLPLTQTLQAATLAAVDPSGADAPSIVPIALQAGALDGIAIAVAPAGAFQAAASGGGFALDPTRGHVLAWAMDAQSHPLANVIASAPDALGPLYDGASPNALEPTGATGPRGAVALFNIGPTETTVSLHPRAPFIADQYQVPIRPNAVTITIFTVAAGN